MISQKDIRNNNLTREDVIKIIMEATNSDRATAEFIYAIETGETDGDLIPVDKEGNIIKTDESLSKIKLDQWKI
jgi:hypothetical protein